MTALGQPPQGQPQIPEGPICLLRLTIGVELPVLGDVEEVKSILNGDDDFVELRNIHDEPLVLQRNLVAIFSEAVIQAPQGQGQPGLLVPDRSLAVPGRDF